MSKRDESKKIRIIRISGLTKGILFCLVGLLHCLAGTPEYYSIYSEALEPRISLESTIFFFFSGFAILYLGFLSIYSSLNYSKQGKFAWNISFSADFVIIGFVLGMYFFASRMGGFSKIMLFAAMINSILLILFKGKICNSN